MPPSTAGIFLESTTLLVALPWLVPFLLLPRLLRRTPRLEDAAAIRDRPVSVIVPARNEGETIDALLTSLRASTCTDLEILVVDDQSSDDTADRVAVHAAEDPRVRLLPGAPLPAGWFGKPWACWQGYRHARADLLLFTDADTTHAPDLHARAIGELQATSAGLVTVMGAQRCETFWERVIQPLVFSIIAVRYHPADVNGARRVRHVIANGQFILVTREGYEAVGTHEAVRGDVAEDLALAQTYFRAGRPVRFLFGDTLFSTRMYRSLSGLVEGWSKNALVGARATLPDEPLLRAFTPLALVAAPVHLLLPWLLLLAVAAGAPPGPAGPAVAAGAGLLFWTILFRSMGVPARFALGYPLGGVMLLYIYLRSIHRGVRRIEWRGRTYDTTRGPA